MVRNFREGLIFTFFVSPEPFMKMKIVKFLLSSSKAKKLHFNPFCLKLSSCQHIYVAVGTDAQTGQQQKDKSGSRPQTANSVGQSTIGQVQ